MVARFANIGERKEILAAGLAVARRSPTGPERSVECG
jgi:hypothetical protein